MLLDDSLVTFCCCTLQEGCLQRCVLPFDTWFESKCRTLGIPHDAHHQNIKLDQRGSQVENSVAKLSATTFLMRKRSCPRQVVDSLIIWKPLRGKARDSEGDSAQTPVIAVEETGWKMHLAALPSPTNSVYSFAFLKPVAPFTQPHTGYAEKYEWKQIQKILVSSSPKAELSISLRMKKSQPCRHPTQMSMLDVDWKRRSASLNQVILLSTNHKNRTIQWWLVK